MAAWLAPWLGLDAALTTATTSRQEPAPVTAAAAKLADSVSWLNR